MRHNRISALAGLALVVAGSGIVRAADLGVRVGYYTEAEDPYVGGELLMRVNDSVYFNPNAEYVLAEGREYLTLNADVHYDFDTHDSTYFWVGAGLGLVVDDPDGPTPRREDAAANFLVGMGLSRGPLVPYFQAKVIAKDDTEFSVGVGLRF